MEDLTKAIELNPDEFAIHCWRGLVHHEMNNEEFGDADFEKALKLGWNGEQF